MNQRTRHFSRRHRTYVSQRVLRPFGYLQARRCLGVVLVLTLIATPLVLVSRRPVSAQLPQTAPLPTPGVPGLNLPNLETVRQMLPPPAGALWYNIESSIDRYQVPPNGVRRYLTYHDRIAIRIVIRANSVAIHVRVVRHQPINPR